MTRKFCVRKLFAPIFLAFCLGMPGPCLADSQLSEITIQDAAKLIESPPANLLILDVRTPAEFQEGHISGAKNLDFFGGSFDMDIMSLPKEDTILVYCRSGKRSAGAAQMLQEAGFRKILHMDDGIREWKRKGFPVERSPQE